MKIQYITARVKRKPKMFRVIEVTPSNVKLVILVTWVKALSKTNLTDWVKNLAILNEPNLLGQYMLPNALDSSELTSGTLSEKVAEEDQCR